MLKKIFIIILFCFTFSQIYSQNTAKKPLDPSVYKIWKHLHNQQISNNGEWISYEINPGKGDGKLLVVNAITSVKDSISRGYEALFSPNSNYITFKIKPQFEKIRELKLDGVDKKDLPKDTLGILLFATDSLMKFANVKSFKTAKDSSAWMAFVVEMKKQKRSETDSVKVDTLKKNGKGECLEQLVIYNPILNEKHTFNNISNYEISDNGSLIGFISNVEDSVDTTLVSVFETKTGDVDTLFHGKGTSKKIILNRAGDQVAFISSGDTTKVKTFSLYLWDKSQETEIIIDTLTKELPESWTVSEHGKIYFSSDNSKLFFGAAQKPEHEKPDTLLEDEKYNVDIWHWKDPYIQSYQKEHFEEEQNRSYLAVYQIEEEKIVPIENPQIRNSAIDRKGICKYAIGYADLLYAYLSQWNSHSFRDYYLINVETGKKTKIAKKSQNYYRISPDNQYIFWYDKDTQDWFTNEIATNETKNLTENISANFFNEENDRPRKPYSYGFAGWTKGDKYFLIYDNYDIWKIDPQMLEKPANLTNHFGRNNEIRFRFIDLDEENIFLDAEKILLKGFDEKSKKSGFYTTDFGHKKNPLELIQEDCFFYYPIKARDSESLIWRKMSFEKYPDLYKSNSEFKNIQKISNANPQQANYLWGTSELVEWVDSTGQNYQGILYKPENFDPSKKYPMIVKIYEKESDRLNSHYSPKPSSCIINYTYYTSNGYLVFRPDIHYKTGHPGQDALRAVVSGTNFILDRGFVDKNKIGLIGHSWGGYETAYIVTQTDKFAAAMAGAPVSNMTSAYGGIRWGSGSSRQHQYEKGQSRIGESLWENRELYLENSPLFYADKVNTPLLILHNDNDGAVPREQGIELFLALRRLQKPVWMFDYNNEKHTVRRWANQVDLSKRLSQFFDHFLKGKPAPEWLKNGIPAIKKGKEDGYDIK
ncbi:MAG: prolyl oligopeptidase family serine peptidase [Candidatus Cloacimonadota bacterium]|nr:prolyl oligopeptidase family serine peptidase [Candidatus Cloacimonadota bacterium]